MRDSVEMPKGTVTFLFSDIEGSTRLVQALGDDYPKLLDQHQRLLRSAFAERGGVVVGTEGDSFFVVFPGASEALRAAIDSQLALEAHPWPEGGRVRVRIGLHTGEGTLGADSYVGVGMWDDIFILVNSTTYGGSGGTISVASVHPQANDVIRHEYGHSFADLADEYSSAYPGYPPGDGEPNVDYDSARSALKWAPWVDAGTPLPTPDSATYNGVVGAFEGARYLTTGIYRPCRNCLMRSLGQQFCPVCKEAHIVEYFRRIAPADAVAPATASEVPVPAAGAGFGVTPIPFTGFQYAWTLGGAPLAGATGASVTLTAAQLPPGVAQTLSVAVSYPTALVRIAPVSRSYSWTVRATAPPARPDIPAHWTFY